MQINNCSEVTLWAFLTDAKQIQIQTYSDSTVFQKSWDVALGPMKQIPMNLFIMWMAGSTISIFPIMMVGMMFIRPIQALMSIQQSKIFLDNFWTTNWRFDNTLADVLIEIHFLSWVETPPRSYDVIWQIRVSYLRRSTVLVELIRKSKLCTSIVINFMSHCFR